MLFECKKKNLFHFADTKKHGYNSCERCEDYGESSDFSNYIRLLSLNAKLRSDYEWNTYLDHWWDPKKKEYVKTSEPFRKPGYCPFEEWPQIMSPVSD